MPLIQFAPGAETVDPATPPAAPATLDSCDAEVRRAAVYAIDAAFDGDLLVAHIGVEPDAGIRALIIDRLVATGDFAVAGPLLGLLRHDDVGLRNAVVAALPLLGEALLPGLVPLLDDPDPAVRIAAVNLLHGLRSRRAVDLAIATLTRDPHVNVCAAAVDILAEAGSAEAIAPLQALVRRFPDSPYLAFAVGAAIKRIG